MLSHEIKQKEAEDVVLHLILFGFFIIIIVIIIYLPAFIVGNTIMLANR